VINLLFWSGEHMRSLGTFLMRTLIILFLSADSYAALAQQADANTHVSENTLSTPDGPRALVLGPRIPVNPPDSGYHGEVMIAADPESADNLIVCGYRADPRTGSGYEGYVYQSGDGGRTWHETLVDAQSQWVSEESCSFGPGHQAYFADGVSDTSRGEPHHEYGNLHLYRSADGGHAWQTILVNRFMDYTSMAVDASGGPRRGTLYIFANTVVDGTTGGWAMMDKTPYLATLRDRADLDFTLTSGSFNSGEAGVRFPGKYAEGAAVLSDGTALSIFPGDKVVFDHGSGKESRLFSIEMGTSRDGGKTLNKSTVHESLDQPGAISLTVNEATDEIYVCWTPRYGKNVESKLMLATSRDKGYTWNAKSINMPPQDHASDVRVDSASVAVNRNGVLGFMWYGKNADSVYFGVSFDDGGSIAKVVPLTPDSLISPTREGEQADDRRLFVYPPVWKNSSRRLESLKVLLFGPNPWGVPSGNGLVADRNGVFHPTWNEVANGATHLWTRAVSLRVSTEGASTPTAAGLMNISDKVVWHVSDVRYDRLGSLVTFDIMVTNKSEATIGGPILVVMTGSGGQAELSADNADNGKRGDGALWELQIPADGLRLEHRTAPRTLSFRTSVKPEDIVASNKLLEIHLEIYGELPK
jgi:hypothetical protein